MTAWLTIEPVYEAILRSIKDKGIKVFHRKLKNGLGGCFDGKKCIITIDVRSKGKVEGCYLLLHELRHYYQWRDGHYPFNNLGEYNEKNLQKVIDAEMDAVLSAHKELKKWGIDYEPSEMSKGGMEESVIFWKKYYFGVAEK